MLRLLMNLGKVMGNPYLAATNKFTRMKHILLLAGLAFSLSAISQTLYEEGFEGFAAGDYISTSDVWITWAGGDGTAKDAQVSMDQAHEGMHSLHLFADAAAGGPMDVVLTAGLDGGVYDASFWMYIPDGSSGYYNVQEDVAPGVGWAFDVTFAFSGDFQVVADEVTVGGGSFPLDQWFEVHHMIDMDNDVVTLTIDGVVGDPFPFDSPFGGVNFFGYGDGQTIGNYYVDDINLSASNPAAIVSIENDLAFSFGPNPATNFINIQGQPNDAWMRVIALNGQLVLEGQLNNLSKGEMIEFNLEDGIYFLELTSGQERSTQRLVVSH